MTGASPTEPGEHPRSGRVVLWASLTFISILTLAIMFVFAWYDGQGAQGEREWTETRRDLAARGESLDAARFIPPPMPDEQNLAMAPFFVWLYRYKVDPATGLLTFGEPDFYRDAFVNSLGYGKNQARLSKPRSAGGWRTGHPTDLAALQRYYRMQPDLPHSPSLQSPAEDVLLALTAFEPTLREIEHAVAARPSMRAPINWTEHPGSAIRSPLRFSLQNLIDAFRIRACADLAAGRTDDAFRDIMLGMRLVSGVHDDHFLLARLSLTSSLSLQMEPIWQGLAERRWSPAQLADLQARLQELDLLDGFRQAVRLERAVVIAPMVGQMHEPDGVEQVFAQITYNRAPPAQPFRLILQLIPRGWGDKAVAFACRRMQSDLIDSVNITDHRLDAHRMKALDSELTRHGAFNNNLLAGLVLPMHTYVGQRTARIQTALDEAVIACALERFCLDRHSYPERLDELTPTYLLQIPVDVIAGAPLRYERTAAGRYRLWGIGWDEVDDGGQVAWNRATPPAPDEKKGDWVWQYEPLSPP